MGPQKNQTKLSELGAYAANTRETNADAASSSKGSQQSMVGSNSGNGNGASSNHDPEIFALVQELAAAEGRQVTEEDMQKFLSSPSAANTESDSDSDEPRELCDFCKSFGKPCCLKCLLGRGSRQISNVHGNVYGFAG